MSTVATPQLVDVVDVFSSRRSHPSGAVRQLDVCQIEPWGLALECTTPEDPVYEGEITWLLLDPGIRLTRYRPRRRHAMRGPTQLTSVQIQRDTRSWTTTDLLLGLEVPDHGAARISQSEEFAAAVSAGVIRLSQADYALRTVHRTLEEFAVHRDINQWLAYRGIFAMW